MTAKSIHKGSPILIKKASGEEEPFDISKLERSLHNSGAEEDIIKEVVREIEAWIVTGITTKKIYTQAFQLLKQKKTTAAIYYKLKNAIMELGPTGYPFEKFIGKIFEKQGFDVQVAQVLEGFCITHEMDVIATNKHVQHIVECKYRTAQEKNISIQVPLYVRSRIDDIVKKRKSLNEYQNLTFEGWIVTNTRFSPDSIDYGKCSGLHLLGWDYPVKNGLKDIIEQEKLYPLTLINQLAKKDKQLLLNQGLVLCSEILAKPEVLEQFQLSKPKYKALMKELHEICG
jgi:Holliday junction resolvase-like predicted endonuclease